MARALDTLDDSRRGDDMIADLLGDESGGGSAVHNQLADEDDTVLRADDGDVVDELGEDLADKQARSTDATQQQANPGGGS